MKKKTNFHKNYNLDNYIGIRFDLSTCKKKDLISLIEKKELELNKLVLKKNRLPYHDWFINGLTEQLKTLNEELHIRNDMKAWINDDNAIKLGDDQFIEQTTQWKHIFSEIELIKFYKREFLNV